MLCFARRRVDVHRIMEREATRLLGARLAERLRQLDEWLDAEQDPPPTLEEKVAKQVRRGTPQRQAGGWGRDGTVS